MVTTVSTVQKRMTKTEQKSKEPISSSPMGKILIVSLIISTILLSTIILTTNTTALPSGADITYNKTAGAPYNPPSNRTDPRGTITTLVLDGTQQVQTWKGYVGNVTGALSLKDADGYTLYDWNLNGVTITGQVYAVRDNSVDFSAVSCASSSTISNEQTFYNMTTTQVDNIDNTFSYQNHTSFYVGSQQISANSCKSTATFINSTAQTVSDTSDFQEVLLQDSNNILIFTTIIEDDVTGYNQKSYDFQMIVAESPVKSTPTTYYFYTEISSA